MPKIISIDAETNGLRGVPFAVAAIMYEDGKETGQFVARCPIEGEVDPWVVENVLSQMTEIEETYDNVVSMLRDFMKFIMENKEGANVIAHIGSPVESGLFARAYGSGLIGEFDAPIIHEVATMLLMMGENPWSVDSYVEKNSLPTRDFVGGTHNPLTDSERAAAVAHHIMKLDWM